MSLDKKLFKAVSTTTTTADAAEGLVLHLDANDEDSIESGGANTGAGSGTWFDISTHDLNVPLIDKGSNLVLHLNASDTTSYGGSGTTWTDLSTYGNDGAISNTGGTNNATFESDTRGYFDFERDDGNDNVEVTDSSSLDITTNITLEAWINEESVNDYGRLFWKNGAYALYRGSNGWYFLTGTHAFVHNSDIPSTGTWYHIAATYDGANKKLYINGTLVGQTGASHSIPTNNNNLYIGGIDSGRFFDGKVSSVRIYNVALTDSEVAQNYRAGNFINYSSIITSKHEATQGTLHTSNLELNLEANSYSGSGDWSDTSGNNRHATINGATYVNNNNSDYFEFDGSANDYVKISDTALVQSNGTNFTVEAWVRRTQTGTYDYIASQTTEDGNSQNWLLRFNNNNTLGWYIYGSNNYMTTSSTYSADVWYHVVGLVESNGTSRIYVDGTLITSSSSGQSAKTSSYNTFIGNLGDGSYATTGDADIAQIRIYSSALTQAQINTNYNATKPLYQNPMALIDYRPENYSGSGTSITNSGSLSNNAVLTGGIESTFDKELGDFFTIDGSSNTGDGIETTSNVTGFNLSSNGFSWEFWFKITSDTYSYIASFNYNTTDWNLSYRSNVDKIQFFGGTIAQTPTLEINRWYHIVASADSNGKNLYLDGVLVDSNTSAAPNATLNSKIYFGTYHSHSDYSHIHTGPLGDMRFYEGVLSSAQVAQNYLATKNKYPNGFNVTNNGAIFDNTDKAFSFNGSNQYFYNSGYPLDFGTSDYTVILWFNSDTNNQNKALFSLYNTQGLMIDLRSDGTIRHYHDGSGSTLQYYTSETISTGTWYQLAVTLNRANNLASMFVSTKSTFDSTASTSSIGNGATTSGNGGTNIARYNSGFYFDGKIANVRVYQKALSSSEIESVWNTDKNNIP